LETIAEKRGDDYVINGSKTFITGVDVADYMLLVTRTKSLKQCEQESLPKAFGLSLFIVDTRASGISKTVIPTRGIEGMNQWSVYFDNVNVPAENMIGEEHAGAMALFKALNPERILAAATAVGVSDYCLNVACAYARERKVFRGIPIGQYQGIQHPLADVKIRQEAVRIMTYKAAWAFDQGLPPLEAGLYANCAKYLGAELGVMAADAAIEALGGNGFSDDYGIAHLWESMRLLKTAPISREMILNYVAEHTLELPRSY
jgi:alkylation response protein AidB-like acyl-CoA dehydrogenase